MSGAAFVFPARLPMIPRLASDDFFIQKIKQINSCYRTGTCDVGSV